MSNLNSMTINTKVQDDFVKDRDSDMTEEQVNSYALLHQSSNQYHYLAHKNR